MCIKSLLPQSLKNLYHYVSALIATLYYRYPAKNLTVIGVTGTDGKTTTASMIYHILNQCGKSAALISTVAAYIYGETVDTGFHTTTPNEWTLQKLLAYIKKRSIKYVVLETTSIGLDQHRLLGTNIKIAAFTNITHEHLDYHRNFNHYSRAKAKLARSAHHLILNQDNNSYTFLKPYLPSTPKLHFYSLQNFSRQKLLKEFFSARHNQENALAAIRVVEILKINQSQALDALRSFKGVPGRLEKVPNQKGIYIYVDFAHTPNAIKSVLSYLKTAHQGKLITVFGATGRRDPTKRPLMGQNAAGLADEVILTADDTYGENINHIIRDIKTGVTVNHGHVHALPDRLDAIKFALKIAKKGDTLAVLGQGHEQSLNLDGHTETPWNDIQIIKGLINS